MTTIKTLLRVTECVMAMGLLFQAGQAANFNVDIRDNFFSPSSLTINVGDTVTWTQRGFNHNTQSQP